MPGMLVSAILTFINAWGAFLIPLVLDGNPSDTPGAVGIYQFLDANAQVQYGPLAAYSILFSIPVLALYLISSRWLQGGFAFAGGIKGWPCSPSAGHTCHRRRSDRSSSGQDRSRRRDQGFKGSVAVDHLDLEVEDGEFLVHRGPVGLRQDHDPAHAGRDSTRRPAERSSSAARRSTTSRRRTANMAMVFQNYALFPHMTVEKNLAFGMKIRDEPRATIRPRSRTSRGCWASSRC